MILNTALTMVFVCSNQKSATYYGITETDALVCHEISKLTGERL